MESAFISRYLPQQFSDRNGQVVRGYFIGSIAVSTNNTLVSAVSGAVIWVPSIVLCPNNAARGKIILKSGTSNNRLLLCSPAPTDPVPSLVLPFNEAGWVATDVGAALVADVTGDTLAISFPYFVYTP